MIVKDPVDCRECDTTFCKECCDQVISKGKPCPKKCAENEKFTYKKINRNVKLLLSESKYKCNIGDCDKIFEYDGAMQHLNSCEF